LPLLVDQISTLNNELNYHSSFNTRVEGPRKKSPPGGEIVEIRIKVDVKGESQHGLVDDIIAAHGGLILEYFRIGPISYGEQFLDFLKKIWLTTTSVCLGTIGSIIIVSVK
jgi:hypothetical protein